MTIKPGSRYDHTITSESWHVLEINGKKDDLIATCMYTGGIHKIGRELTIAVKQIERLLSYNLIKER